MNTRAYGLHSSQMVKHGKFKELIKLQLKTNTASTISMCTDKGQRNISFSSQYNSETRCNPEHCVLKNQILLFIFVCFNLIKFQSFDLNVSRM